MPAVSYSACKHESTESWRQTSVNYFFFALAWFFSSKAACAAAKRAIGTRKGEQLTYVNPVR